jgi:phage/plasmid-associated DNA primase
MPVSPDETDAFVVRLIIISFPNQFLGDKANPNLLNELTTEAEMSALLSMLIRRLLRVLETGINAPHSSIEENYEKYISSSNPIRIFVEKYIEGSINNDETKQDVYNSYERFCMENRLSKESSETFSRRLKKDYDFKDKQVRGKGIPKPYHWLNMRLKDREEVDDDQETLD